MTGPAPESVLVSLDVSTDQERERVVVDVTQSNRPGVTRWLLTPAQARSVAGQLLHSAMELTGRG